MLAHSSPQPRKSSSACWPGTGTGIQVAQSAKGLPHGIAELPALQKNGEPQWPGRPRRRSRVSAALPLPESRHSCSSAHPAARHARRVRPGTLRQRHGWALRDRASDANPLPIFRPGLAVAWTGLSSGWQIGVSLRLAYICLASGIGPWTTRARPPSAVSNSFCFVSALDRYSSLPVRAPCSGKSRRVVAAAASVTIWATDVSP